MNAQAVFEDMVSYAAGVMPDPLTERDIQAMVSDLHNLPAFTGQIADVEGVVQAVLAKQCERVVSNSFDIKRTDSDALTVTLARRRLFLSMCSAERDSCDQHALTEFNDLATEIERAHFMAHAPLDILNALMRQMTNTERLMFMGGVIADQPAASIFKLLKDF